ncbi:MAG TPA: LacI family DNA-binding transcriptional regulator [Rhodothermales bacterium]|nr:LacI family DNA-binding transcriptional regulator [Rhodothermales bacterium]
MTRAKGRTTIYDVASRAGVAISTVSRVINGSSDVAEGTRARVLQAIARLEYRPDRTARALASQRRRTLCIALPSFTTPFHTELLKGVRARLQEQDFDLLLCDLGSLAPAQTLLRFLHRGTVDGLLLAGMPITDELASELRALQAPVVLVGHAWPEFSAIVWDDYAGGRLAMEHLLSLGHRRIGFIRAHTGSELQAGRARAYREALAEAGIAFDPALVQCSFTTKHGGFSEEAGYEAMQLLLRQAPDVAAVFASSDVQAFGVFKAAREAGRRIPEDLSVVGYDGIKATRYVGLTGIDQRIREAGELAADVLLEQVCDPSPRPSVNVTLEPTLCVRTSTSLALHGYASIE